MFFVARYTSLSRGHIAGERSFGLAHFAHLAVEPFRGIVGIDDLPDGFGLLEILW